MSGGARSRAALVYPRDNQAESRKGGLAGGKERTGPRCSGPTQAQARHMDFAAGSPPSMLCLMPSIALGNTHIHIPTLQFTRPHPHLAALISLPALCLFSLPQLYPRFIKSLLDRCGSPCSSLVAASARSSRREVLTSLLTE